MQFSELMRWALNNAFKKLDPQQTRIVLVDPGDRVLRAMPEELSEAALAALERDGIEFLPQGRPNHAARRGGDQQPRW